MNTPQPIMLSDLDIAMVRDASVKVEASTTEDNATVAVLTVNDQYQHRFAPNSRVSKALESTPVKQLEQRLNGGQYFFINDDLVDFRDGNYRGFVHDDDNINALVDVIGVAEGSSIRRGQSNQTNNNYALARVWSENGIDVPMYNEGGKFSSRLLFKWNPFVKTVNSSFQLVRLICTNGMVGLTSFLNSKIPLENRWVEHLDIASKQIQNKIDSMMVNRMSEMGQDRATVNDLLLLEDHARGRIEQTDNAHNRERLKNIINVVSPSLHLGGVYKDSVFADKRLASQMPGHLSAFDAYNIATEMSSHTNEGSNSSNHALDRFANAIVFSRKDRSFHAARYSNPKVASFSDADAAFFGEVV